MDRAALEHVLRAAAALTNEREFIVIGSQSVLGQFPDAPAALLASIEVDVYPRQAPEKSDLIEGAIGELSLFHQTFGYYAHGVDETTATLPPGWVERLVPVQNENTGGAIGLCLEVHDLAISKLVAGREQDIAFIQVLVHERMVDPRVLRDRLAALPIPRDRIDALQARLARMQGLTRIAHPRRRR
jgi:hypothetical protein